MLHAEAFGVTAYETFCHCRFESDPLIYKVKFYDKITTLKAETFRDLSKKMKG